jgi:putative polyhydroxyalkanoate system protein
MPKFGVRVPHELSQQEARSRLERFAERLKEKAEGQVSDLQQSWEGDTLHFQFKTYGIQLKGSIAATDKDLNLDGELPFSAMMFRGKIESGIREQLERLVAT